MLQDIKSVHNLDGENPAGGETLATGLWITWQNGPLMVDGKKVDPSGCFVETVIAAALDRLQFYEDSKFTCIENQIAISNLKLALAILDIRTKKREERGVEGTHAL